MFQQLNVPILGIVENMSDFVGDDGTVYDLFGHGGAEMMAQEMNLPFLGALHIHRALRINSDAGRPDRNWESGPVLAQELEMIAKNVAAQVSIATLSGPVQPTIRIT
jgi:ATP-binding protein involved in chromosome partitioning